MAHKSIHPELHALTGLDFQAYDDYAARVEAGKDLLGRVPGFMELATEADYARVAEAEIKLLDSIVMHALDQLVDVANGFQTGNHEKDQALAVSVCFDVFNHVKEMFGNFVEQAQQRLSETMELYLQEASQTERDRVNARTRENLKRLVAEALGGDIYDILRDIRTQSRRPRR